MHCLPRHQEEVADDVFYSDNSVVLKKLKIDYMLLWL